MYLQTNSKTSNVRNVSLRKRSLVFIYLPSLFNLTIHAEAQPCSILGAGFSLNAICASTSVSQNFLPKKRVLALAFVSTGSGIGTLCFPLLLQYFIDTYGWRGCLLIISGIVLNQLACGLMSGPDVIRPAASKFQQNMTENNETGDSNTTLSRLKATLQNKVFIGFCFALSLTLAAFDGLIIFFVDFFEQKGFNRTSVVWLYSGMSIASMIFRFISGLIAQSSKVPKLAIPAMCAFLGCISLSLLPFMTSYSLNAVAIALFGSALGGTVTVVSITTLELVGEKKFPTGLGIVFAASGIANIVGAPIAGEYMEHIILCIFLVHHNCTVTCNDKIF